MTWSGWPVCDKCGRTIEVHYLSGNAAYCQRERVELDGGRRVRWRYAAADRATFGVVDVNAMRRNLGHKVTQRGMELEARERAGEKARARKK